MATRVVLIEAGPTPWDTEGRIIGSRPLPLTAEGIDAMRHLVETLPFPVQSVYRPRINEACDQAAKMIAQRFDLRPRDNADLDAVNLGHWEGLTPADLNFRFPTVFPQWLENPLAVTPPDGEALPAAVRRISDAARRIVRRNRGLAVALALRPMSLQIALGTLSGETLETIASHLHRQQPIATIEIE